MRKTAWRVVMIFAVVTILALLTGLGWRYMRRKESQARIARLEVCVAEADRVIDAGTNTAFDGVPIPAEGRWWAAQADEAVRLHRTREQLLNEFAAALDEATAVAAHAPPEVVHLRWRQAGDLALALLRGADAEKYYRLATPGIDRFTQGTVLAMDQARIANALRLQERFSDEYYLRVNIDLARSNTVDLRRVESEIRFGLASMSVGQWDAAKVSLTGALGQLEKQFGPDSPEILAALNPLAGLEADTDDNDKCQEYSQRAREIAEKSFGSDDYRTALQTFLLADILRTQSHLERAEDLMRMAAATCEKARGANDFYTGECNHVLGSLLLQLGKYSDAESRLTQSEPVLESTLPANAAMISDNLAELAVCVQAQERLPEAERLFRRAMAMVDRFHSMETPGLISQEASFAVLLTDLGKFDEAKGIVHRAAEAFAKLPWRDDLHLATAQVKLKGLLQNAGRTKAPRPLLDEVTKFLENNFSEETTSPANTEAWGLADKGSAALVAGNFLEAETYLRKATALYEATSPATEQASSAWNNLGLTLQNVGRYTEAERYFRRALEIDLKLVGPENPTVADENINLAANYKLCGRPEEALPLAQHALDVYERRLGKEDHKVAIVLNDIAAILVDLRKWDEAERLQRRSIAIVEKLSGMYSQEFAERMDFLSSIFEEAQEFAKAEPVLRRLIKLAVDSSHSQTPQPEILQSLTSRYKRCLQSLGQNHAAIDERCERLLRGESLPDL